MSTKRRLLAIWFWLWYGVRPWWMYEQEKHHRGGYLGHFRANLHYAWVWLTWTDSQLDHDYEAEVNGGWSV